MRRSRHSILCAFALGVWLPALPALPACGSDKGNGEGGGSGDAGFDGAPPDIGTLLVTFDATTRTTTVRGACAALDMLVAAPAEANVGHAIQLDASGLAPGSTALTRADVVITWAALGSAGSLAASAGLSNVFECTSTGSSTVTATASIEDGGASCASGGSLDVTVVCD